MTSVQEVPLKIALVRSGEVVEVRRRRLVNPGYAVVEKVASEVARGTYRLQYTDEDGDVVTMSSQEEWEECLASWDASHPLNLRIELRGPRGVGRSGCRSGSRSRSRSRSTSSHRRCHRRSRSRSVSSNGKHHRWGRRSVSPSRRCTEVPSRHGSPFGRAHSPLRFQAWLAKMEAARRMKQASCSMPSEVGHPFLCRGFPFGAGKGFKGMHGHCGRRMQTCGQPAEAPERTTDTPSSDEQPPAEHPLFLFRDLIRAFAGKGMHGHGKGSKGAHGHGGKGCKGMPEHTGHRHMHNQDCTPADAAEKANAVPSSAEEADAPPAEHPLSLFRDLLGAFAGKGMHGHGKGSKGAHGHGGKGCKGMPGHSGHRHMHNQDCTPAAAAEKANAVPSSAEEADAPQAEHPLSLFRDLLGAFAGKGMHGHGKGSKGAHGHGGKGCKGMPEHTGHRHMHHGRRAVNSELIGQRCANCEFQTTGVVDLYCCRACMFGKDHHGKRCQQLPFAEDGEQKTAQQTPASAVACSSEAVEGAVEQVKQAADEAQGEPTAALPEEQPGNAATPTCSEATAADDGEWVHAAAATEQCAAGEAQPDTTEAALTEQGQREEGPAVVEEEPTPNTAEEPQTIAVEEQPSTAEEEPPVVQAPFARQIAQLREMGFAVTPQTVDNLAAANGDLAAVVAGLFAH